MEISGSETLPTPDFIENRTPEPPKKRVVVIFEKNDMAPVVLLEEYDLIEINPAKGPWVGVHIKKDKDDRWANAAECVVLDAKTKFLLTAILAKQAQIERHQKEIAKLTAQMKKYALSNDPAFKSEQP